LASVIVTMEAPQLEELHEEAPAVPPIPPFIPPPQPASSSPQVARPASEPRIVFDPSMVLTFRT
jgi:hypothetical protein